MNLPTVDDDPFSSAALERAVAEHPRDGRWRYLRGADHASAGRYEDAIADLQAALRLDDGLHAARLQLGLLHLTLGQGAAAEATLRPLEALSQHDPLRLFAHGLRALIADDLATCMGCLEEGIRLNVALPPLNRDMALLLERVRSAALTGATTANATITDATIADATIADAAPTAAADAPPPPPSRPAARPRSLSLYDTEPDT